MCISFLVSAEGALSVVFDGEGRELGAYHQKTLEGLPFSFVARERSHEKRAFDSTMAS